MENHPPRPPHLYQSNACYFLTASTVDHQRFLEGEEERALLRDILKETVLQYRARLYAWVILADHYHLLLWLGKTVPIHRLVRRLHGANAIGINKLQGTGGRKVWHQYWDRCVRSEDEFWSLVNYIHINPLKHGYVGVDWAPKTEGDRVVLARKQTQDLHRSLACYPFSSYSYYLRKYGEEFLGDLWVRYGLPAYLSADAD